VDYNESDVDEHEPTPATPVESAHTTPSPVPRGRQEDEESDIFDDDRSDTFFWRDERPKQRSFSEDEAEAEAYFKQYVTSTFHPDDKTADNKIRVIYPLVKPPESITTQTVPSLSVQERQSATKVRDHRRNRYKARFWPLYATSYNKAKKASQTETVFRMSLTREKLGFRDLNTYTYERRIWPTQLGGQLWGTPDSFLPTRPLPFDNTLRTSLDVVRHSRPSSSYNRVYDPTESAQRALPYGTGRILSRLHRGMVRPYPRIHVCTSTIYKRVDNRAVRPHANTSVAGLPARRIRLPSRTRESRHAPPAR
jgi:hypothetical protein